MQKLHTWVFIGGYTFATVKGEHAEWEDIAYLLKRAGSEVVMLTLIKCFA